MSLALEDDSTTLDEEDFGATADEEDTGTADEEDSGTTADEEETRTTDEEDSFTLQHAVSGGSSLEDDGMTLDEETYSTEDELSFPVVSGEVDEESSPQAISIAAKDTAIQPAKSFFMKTSYLILKYKLKSPA